MARVKGRDTRPEQIVRRLVSSLGHRYRLSPRGIAGRPDLAMKGRRKAIFVHGCFWHRHQGCKLARLPKSRHEFWLPKLEGNRLRDERNMAALRSEGWTPIVIWECELRDADRVKLKLRKYLGGTCDR